MGYLGNVPSEKFLTTQKDRFTGLTGSTVTLSHSVSSISDIIVWVNSVKQDYNSLSVSGTTLTLGGNLVSDDVVQVAYIGRTVGTTNPATSSVTNDMLAGSINENKLLGSIPNSKLANSSITLNGSAVSLGGSATVGGGITEADQWRMTSNQTSTGVITNLERVDTTGGGYIGTGMSQSSGTFTFPSTGIYLINFVMLSDGTTRTQILTTTDNSTYDIATRAYADSSIQSGISQFMFDVTNTSTHKVQFNVDLVSTLYGSTSYNQTHMTFIRLGDT